LISTCINHLVHVFDIVGSLSRCDCRRFRSFYRHWWTGEYLGNRDWRRQSKSAI